VRSAIVSRSGFLVDWKAQPGGAIVHQILPRLFVPSEMGRNLIL
jgi:hypothetical protein